MDQDTELKSIKDEVFLNIGKNVVLSQQIEQLLKALLGLSRMEGVADDLATMRIARLDQSEKLSLGVVAGKFFDDVGSDPATEERGDSDHQDNAKFRISTSFQIESDTGFRDEQIAAMQAMVDQRNELIHEFLPKWDWKSIGSMKSAISHLLRQRETAEAQFNFLKGIHAAHQEAVGELKTFFESDEGQRQIELLWLQQSRIVSLLREAAMSLARQDGWLPIGSAGRIVNEHARDDLHNLKERYGYRTLPELIVGCGFFEVRDEPTQNGSRAMFRLKP